MDALSDVLRAVRLTGAFFFDVHAARRGARKRRSGKTVVDAMFPGSDHLICYHLHHGRQLLGDASKAKSRSNYLPATSSCCRTATRTCSPPSPACARRPRCRCTACRKTASCRRRFPSAADGGELDALRLRIPRLRLAPLQPAADGTAARHPHQRSRAAARSARTFARRWRSRKDGRMGGADLLGRISELMFVDVVRRYLEALPADRINWLVGTARSICRPRVDGAARQSGARLDARSAGAGGGAVALGVRRAFHAIRRAPAHAIPHQLAHAARDQLPAHVAPRAWRRSPTAWVTTPRPRSAAHSRRWWVRRPASGASRCVYRRAAQPVPRSSFSKTKHRSELRNTPVFRCRQHVLHLLTRRAHHEVDQVSVTRRRTGHQRHRRCRFAAIRHGVVVRYGDLNLNSQAGVASLHKRIRNAAESVCSELTRASWAARQLRQVRRPRRWRTASPRWPIRISRISIASKGKAAVLASN